MTITKTEIEGLWIIDPGVFTDERGYFFETFHEQRYQFTWMLFHLFRTMKLNQIMGF